MGMIQKLTNWYFSRDALPYWGILLLDCLIVFCADFLVYALNNGVLFTLQHFGVLAGAFGFYLVFYIIGFRLFHTYSGVIRYSSFVDLQRIGFAMLTGLLLTLGVKYMLHSDEWLAPIRARDLGIAALLATALLWSVRVLVKFLYDSTYRQKRSKRVFIYGVKAGGVGLAKSIKNQESSSFVLTGFVSDHSDMPGRYLMGVKVYPNDELLFDVLAERNVHTVIVSPAKMEKLKNTADRFLEHNIKLLMAPPLSEWKGRMLEHNQLKEVQIEDLLERDPIVINMEKVASHLEGARVMITGAAGSIGSEIMRQVASFNPYKLILIDQAETPLHDVRLELQDKWCNLDAVTIVADISNATRMENIFAAYRPQYIFHAAAYKHVPMMEDNVSEAIQTNVYGTRVLADLAVKYGAEKFVMISTDKAVNPTNVMGCSKRICEIYVQSLAKKMQREGKESTQFITTRFGNVLGSNGSVIPRFRDQIQRGGPVTVTHPDIIRYFMTIPEACRLVLEAGSMGKGGEIFIFDMGKPVKILDLAKRMISLSGRTDVKIEFTGLRHGEKLYEELLNQKELTKPTYHEKIMIATVREYDYDEVKLRIQKLIDVSYGYDPMSIVAMMKDIVPEFISKNSCFEVLDEQREKEGKSPNVSVGVAPEAASKS